MSIYSRLAKMKTRAMGVDVDDVLEVMGLTRKRSPVAVALPILGALMAGLAVGAGIGLLLSPTSLRRQVEDKVRGLEGRLATEGDAVANP